MLLDDLLAGLIGALFGRLADGANQIAVLATALNGRDAKQRRKPHAL